MPATRSSALGENSCSTLVYYSEGILAFCRHRRVLGDRQVLWVSKQGEEQAGGDDHAFLHNMVTSLSLACSVLCALSAFGVVTRNAQVMVQTTSFQAVVAPGLALCGVLLYSSSASVATGEHFEIWVTSARGSGDVLVIE